MKKTNYAKIKKELKIYVILFSLSDIKKKLAAELQLVIAIILKFVKIHNCQQEKEALKKRLRSKISGLRGANCSQFVRTYTALFIHLYNILVFLL